MVASNDVDNHESNSQNVYCTFGIFRILLTSLAPAQRRPCVLCSLSWIIFTRLRRRSSLTTRRGRLWRPTVLPTAHWHHHRPTRHGNINWRNRPSTALTKFAVHLKILQNTYLARRGLVWKAKLACSFWFIISKPKWCKTPCTFRNTLLEQLFSETIENLLSILGFIIILSFRLNFFFFPLPTTFQPISEW